MIFQDSQSSLNPTKRHRRAGRRAGPPASRASQRKDALDRALEVLELVGLPRPKERLGDYPHQLSGGLRQRVMIAIALACEPKVLLADEPTTALDVTIQAQILALLDDLRERLGMATLLVTHDMGVVAGRTSRINVMYAGRIVETAPTRQLFTAMRHPYTQALLGFDPAAGVRQYQGPGQYPGRPARSRPIRRLGCRFAARCPYATEQCRVEEPQLEGRLPWPPVRLLAPGRRPGDDRRGRSSASCQRARRTPPTATAAHLLEMSDAVREYPVKAGLLQRQVASVKAVSDVTLHLDAGETFGLVGESGCGKTTLGKMIVGIEKPDAGKIAARRQGGLQAPGRQAPPRQARRADDVPGPVRVAGPADARQRDPARSRW